MRIIEVIPIQKGISKEVLSYFTAAPAVSGSIVTVPLRRRLVPAIIASSRDAIAERSSIRRAGYELRKIERFDAREFLRPAFMAAAADAAPRVAGTTGSVLAALVPASILANAAALSSAPAPAAAGAGAEKTPESSGGGTECFVLQAADADRLSEYKSLIRESFARGRSVLFIIPTIEEAARAFAALGKGIEEYAFVLDGSLPKKKLLSVWQAALKNPHPVLLIGTGQAMSLPRADFGTIIVENEGSRWYKTQARPFLDFRAFAELLARRSRLRLIIGGQLLRIETLYRLSRGEFLEFSPIVHRSAAAFPVSLIDMRQEKNPPGTPFQTISPALLRVIRNARRAGERVFLFVSRRGVAAETVCRDCGSLVLCETCRTPVALHKNTRGYNLFLCHTCGRTREAAERCAACGSWRLEPIGIGIERVEEELAKKEPGARVFRIDSDAASSAKEAAERRDEFYRTAGAVLIGTEMALRFLSEPIDRTAVVSLDSILSLPDFRAGERVMQLLLRIRALTGRSLTIQTRNAGEAVVGFGARGTLAEFYRHELAFRKQFSYPPFSLLVLLRISGRKKETEEKVRNASALLASYEPIAFPAFTGHAKGTCAMRLLMKLPPEKGMDEKLRGILASLQPEWTVVVDPETLL